MAYGLDVKESDWKLFRKLLPGWQEAHMQRLIDGYADLISGPGPASEKFWKLNRRIKKDKLAVGVVAEIKRSRMRENLVSLLDEGVITLDDLAGFSEELKEYVAYVLKIRGL